MKKTVVRFITKAIGYVVLAATGFLGGIGIGILDTYIDQNMDD